MLDHYFNEEKLPLSTKVWCDVVALNQHECFVKKDGVWADPDEPRPLPPSFEEAMRNTVAGVQKTLACIDSPGYTFLSRIWCLYEVWSTVAAGEAAAEKLEVLVEGMDIMQLRTMLMGVDSTRATSANPEDQKTILGNIKSTIGTQKLDSLIRDSIIASTARAAARKTAPGSGADPKNQGIALVSHSVSAITVSSVEAAMLGLKQAQLAAAKFREAGDTEMELFAENVEVACYILSAQIDLGTALIKELLPRTIKQLGRYHPLTALLLFHASQCLKAGSFKRAGDSDDVREHKLGLLNRAIALGEESIKVFAGIEQAPKDYIKRTVISPEPLDPVLASIKHVKCKAIQDKEGKRAYEITFWPRLALDHGGILAFHARSKADYADESASLTLLRTKMAKSEAEVDKQIEDNNATVRASCALVLANLHLCHQGAALMELAQRINRANGLDPTPRPHELLAGCYTCLSETYRRALSRGSGKYIEVPYGEARRYGNKALEMYRELVGPGRPLGLQAKAAEKAVDNVGSDVCCSVMCCCCFMPCYGLEASERWPVLLCCLWQDKTPLPDEDTALGWLAAEQRGSPGEALAALRKEQKEALALFGM
ncbi:hypothetical protein HYH03_013331 [Edaphochlamys debaryana]|nr:hypothetical protein HYH03_013331 [Edaphochlamys debaryana]|eukprot:KAG2488024.1 hypothetical protein HYH03_013331 [Edaphochlamys debaryana]